MLNDIHSLKTPATHCVLGNIPAHLLMKPVRIELESCDFMFDDPLVYFTDMVSV